MKHQFRIANRITAIVFMIVLLGLSGWALSQGDTPPLCDPITGCTDESIPSELQAAFEAQEKAWMDAFTNRSILSFNVAYLVDEATALSDDLLSGAHFEKIFGAEVFHSWDDFAKARTEKNYQIVFVHTTLMQQIDSAWTKDAYLNKTIFVGLNTTFEPLAALVGDSCLRHPSPTLENYFDVVARVIFISPDGTTKGDVAALGLEYLETCKQSFSNSRNVNAVSLAYPLRTIDDLTYLANTIVADTVSFNIPIGKSNELLPMPTEPGAVHK